MNLMKRNCINLKYVKIPSANRNVTEEYPNIILMEYIDGMKINNVNKKDYEEFAKQILRFGIVTTFIHGVTHGDLHSGNILFIKNKNDDKYPYKIGIIDFGIIYNLDIQYKDSLFDILINIFQLSPRELAEKVLNSKIIEPPGILKKIKKDDYNNILSFTEEIIDETINNSKNVNQIQIYKLISKLKEYLSKKELINIGIKPSDNFLKSQLVLAMAHGLTLKLCNDDFITLMDKTINELLNTKLLL
jgi:predicted unusual protein kinase regulating ubiquinone biosynthesis (AarF/ABC1/UbiB family)